MKLLFLAAAAAIAVPAAAQTTTSDSTAPQDQTTTDQTTEGQTAPAATGEDPVGGYMPSTPPMSGTPEPGANIVFQPSAPPDQAFPAPPPMDEYPVCEAGQFDNCRQRGE